MAAWVTDQRGEQTAWGAQRGLLGASADSELAVGQNQGDPILGFLVHQPFWSILVGIGMFTGGTGF